MFSDLTRRFQGISPVLIASSVVMFRGGDDCALPEVKHGMQCRRPLPDAHPGAIRGRRVRSYRRAARRCSMATGSELMAKLLGLPRSITPPPWPMTWLTLCIRTCTVRHADRLHRPSRRSRGTDEYHLGAPQSNRVSGLRYRSQGRPALLRSASCDALATESVRGRVACLDEWKHVSSINVILRAGAPDVKRTALEACIAPRLGSTYPSPVCPDSYRSCTGCGPAGVCPRGPTPLLCKGTSRRHCYLVNSTCSHVDTACSES